MCKELNVIEQRDVLGKDFKVYGSFEEPLFLAKDVACWIGHSDVSTMLRSVDEDEKVTSIVCTLGGNQEAWFLTEDGVYEVLMQSRKPIAKRFKKQVKEILKSIRMRGYYTVNKELEERIKLLEEKLTNPTTPEKEWGLRDVGYASLVFNYYAGKRLCHKHKNKDLYLLEEYFDEHGFDLDNYTEMVKTYTSDKLTDFPNIPHMICDAVQAAIAYKRKHGEYPGWFERQSLLEEL